MSRATQERNQWSILGFEYGAITLSRPASQPVLLTNIFLTPLVKTVTSYNPGK